MRILVTGGTGFIGQSLLPALRERAGELVLLSRRSRPDEPGLRFVRRLDDIDDATHFDAVINLAGASLAGRRWSQGYKREMVASRVGTTRELVALFKRLPQPPAVLLSGSAVGYYGHRGDEILDESSPPGEDGFARDLCMDWEGAAVEAQALGTRVCLMRLGVVLDNGGGAFEQMARSFNFGFGSWIGSGEQWLSWIHRADAVAAMLWLLDHPELDGPFNLTAPQPVTSREFCRVLSDYKRTLLDMPLPAPVARLLLGEMADELLIHGQRVVPSALEASGFAFSLPDLPTALASICAD
ncbi:TIGR01777 family protein [Mangrovimicrobium sediminis]|uniref:TIGR01777 family protein n=1 Tax=Mangrovimicrobium sediminis TaxID=2562682 RepID=A0A4Z0M2F8_9GAMM|nr:TIGR01777 family oxidoreductase [Haliea sp. SAOS-164]TGD73617.1 TIGR01777 family protein [Haliea sp. SAOS-164]